MATLKDLAKRLNNYADKIEAAPSQVAAAFTFVLVEELAMRTPVDTSKALSNWLVSLDDPVLIDMDAYYEGIRGSTAMASVREVLAFANTVLGKKKPGRELFISNAAPYIRDLENGTSRQAPLGFTKQSLAFARSKLPAIIKKVLNDGR
jgi:hypothetical protein